MFNEQNTVENYVVADLTGFHRALINQHDFDSQNPNRLESR